MEAIFAIIIVNNNFLGQKKHVHLWWESEQMLETAEFPF